MSARANAVDPTRLSLARRLRRLTRAELARQSALSPSAITQFEKGDAKPTAAALARIAFALQMPAQFFDPGTQIARIAPTEAHFRSLRSTPALTRDQALAYAELVITVVGALEDYVEFPKLQVPVFELPPQPASEEIASRAQEARVALRLGSGPVPNMVRALEAAGCVVVRLPEELSTDIDAFSTSRSGRPLILLSPAKSDKARSRFDAAHELGHLVMHPDVAPGSKIVEAQAHQFAAEFLLPAHEIVDVLPRRLDWNELIVLKRKWGVSLAALAYRARTLEVWSDATAQRAFRTLRSQGFPEMGSLGAQEQPTLVGLAFDLLEQSGTPRMEFANDLGLPMSQLEELVAAGSEQRPRIDLGP